ncbi:unnamed protein product [Prunus armeniaca]|uniref:Uncharacterized protein n=1 Tax=Prunus armeniaca TaxID=36596 RepID=A0A6J5Y180_PRUAR|nr:unnamed protein product [Prunus armeniaca]
MLRFHVQSRKNVGVVSTLFQAPQLGACNYFPALHARKRNLEPEPLLKPTIIKEVSEDDEDDDDVILDNFEEDEASMNDEGDDYYEEESVELCWRWRRRRWGVWLDNKALEIAEEVILSFDGDPKIYAFKTLPNFTIQVRIEKLLNRSGSPSMEDIEAFSRTCRARLDEAELAKLVPENLSLEVFFYSLCSPFLT